MSASSELNRMLWEYRQGCINREELEGKLFMHIRKNPSRFSPVKLKKETWDDFVSWLYPRLHRAVDRYADKGSSFDAYILTTVRLSVKEYGLQKKEHRIIEKTWWTAKAEETAVFDTGEMEYIEESPALPKVHNPRQALILLLKSYYHISDTRMAQLAPALGLEKDELYRMVDELRVLRLQREENIHDLKERIHGQFYRCLAFEKRMKAAPYHSPHWQKMKRCLETGRKRLLSMRRRLQVMRMEASNEEVAKVMKVAKGTVDSNLYAARQRNQTESQ